MKTTNARKKAAKLVADSLESRITALKATDEFKQLKAQIKRFQDNGGDNYHLDESGDLVSSERIYLDRSLCADEDGNPDTELAAELLAECSDTLYFHQDDYSQGYFEWVMEMCHGEPCIVTYPPERHCYAVYCRDLGLKVNRIESEEHGIMLAEQAMRSRGYFPNLVNVDQCSFATHLHIPLHIQNASDSELAKMISKIESQDNNE